VSGRNANILTYQYETAAVYGCIDPSACNVDDSATIDDGSCLYLDCTATCGGAAWENDCGCVGGTSGMDPGWCLGCTDSQAMNFHPQALVDDGSCQYMGDLDGDQEINIIDVVILVEIILDVMGSGYEPTEPELYFGDINNDERLDIIDVVQLVGLILGAEY